VDVSPATAAIHFHSEKIVQDQNAFFVNGALFRSDSLWTLTREYEYFNDRLAERLSSWHEDGLVDYVIASSTSSKLTILAAANR
jgi:hypothetical protein